MSRKQMKSLHHSPKGPSQLRLNWGVATRYSRGKRSGLWLPIDSISRICKGWECHWLLDPLRFHPFILKNAKRTVWVYHCGERKKEDVGFTWISSMSSTQPAQPRSSNHCMGMSYIRCTGGLWQCNRIHHPQNLPQMGAINHQNVSALLSLLILFNINIILILQPPIDTNLIKCSKASKDQAPSSEHQATGARHR